MALPFLKNRDDGIGVGTVETQEREHDDDFDMLDAVAGDLLTAIKKGDKGALKAALSALCDHIATMDEEQDQSMGEMK